MKNFHKIVQVALLVTTPALMAHPINEIPKLAQHTNHLPIQIPDLRTLSYDDVIDLLSKIESDSFDERYSMDELDQINQFISLLAKAGITDDEKIDTESAVASLFRKEGTQYALFVDSEIGYTVKPAIYIESSQDLVRCKNWAKKQWNQTKSFVKKYKKAIIIGAIVVVTVAVVIVAAVAISSAAAASAAAATGGALASVEGEPETAAIASNSLEETSPSEFLVSSLQTQVSNFKETIAQEQFAAAPESNGISMEENGRIIGSLFAHKAVDILTTDLIQNSAITNELKDFGFNLEYPLPKWLETYPDSFIIAPHPSTDLAFSTNYATSYAGNFDNLNALSYQVRGDLAFSSDLVKMEIS